MNSSLLRCFRAVVAIVLVSIYPAAARGAVPAGFQDTLVATVSAPTAIAFTPDGRLLITTQTGRLLVYDDGVLLAAPALDLGPRLCTNSERGLLGVAVDPAFASNRFIYLFYTLRKTASCDFTAVNRVSRFTLADTNTVSTATELVLLDNMPSHNGNHNGGDLHFGRDQRLYVSVGDGGCDYRGDSGCAGANDAARDRHVLLGKILRVTPGGGIPPDNPFLGAGSVRCNMTGRGQPGEVCQETFAWGLRNPFRLAFDPNTTATRFFINDVGQNVWEEINEGRPGADYGWNVREGHCVNGSATNCGPPPPGMTNPVYDYAHADGCASITGGAFVPNGVWPAEYTGAYLFSDYVCGRIFRIVKQADGSYNRTVFASGLGGGSAVTMIFGPWQGSQSLYYTTYAGGGQVRRIDYGSNRAPVAVASATPRSGAVPLQVRLDAAGSSDPDGDPLTYEWDPGDGTAPLPGAVVTHTYQSAGTFTARLTVRDNRGGSATAAVVINAGNRAPSATITSPTATATFTVGQTITLTGSATDPDEGALPATRLSWRVILHHNTHTHPFLSPTSGNNVTFTAPAPEDLAATTSSYLEIELTATDSQGASTIVTRNFQPRLVALQLETAPTGLTVTANGTAVVTPRTITSWAGYQITLAAPTQRDASGRPWLFASWSDGGGASHAIVTPGSAATYTATFASATATVSAADAYVRGGAYASQNFGAATTMQVKRSDSADFHRRAFARFTVAGAVGRAVLRLRAALSEPGDIPVAVFPVASTTWSEAAVTWNSQPAIGATPVATVTARDTAGVWLEWDVTSYVRAEQAAGRTTVSFAFIAMATTPPYPYLILNSREAASNRPELLTSSTQPSPPPSGEVVLYAADASAINGALRRVADASAAGGLRLHHHDGGAAKVAAPLAMPANFVDVPFVAEAGRGYRLWMRGRADRNDYQNDSVYVQFSGSVTSGGVATYRIGTASATTYVLEDCSGCTLSGWGWQDNGYGTGVLGPLIYFATSGPQTIRIQTREDGLSIDQIVLSPERFRTSAPGALINDTTIVPK
jgi:glucose/arabinose dehydrogenase